MTKEYAQTCENCESVTIARWVDGAWKEIGDFNQFFSLSPSKVSSKISKESLCAIWSTNRSSEFAAKTGCTPDSSMPFPRPKLQVATCENPPNGVVSLYGGTRYGIATRCHPVR
jgi:hypothetical protein